VEVLQVSLLQEWEEEYQWLGVPEVCLLQHQAKVRIKIYRRKN